MEPSLFPFPVDNSITRISHVAYMQDLGSHIRIVVNHLHLFEYKKEDKASKVAAIAVLLKTGAAKQTEIAQAFGITRDTARRYLRNVEKHGSAGLFMAKTGPQGPHKITPKVHTFIVEQLHQNKGVAWILKSVKETFDLELSRKSIERIRTALPSQDPVQTQASLLVQEELSLLEEQEALSGEKTHREPLVAKEAISSDDVFEAGSPNEAPAGLFLLWPFLHLLGFKDMVNTFGPAVSTNRSCSG